MGISAGRKTVLRNVTVAICGNPNCGKTTIFNAITGLHQKVGNYPGVTVEKTFGTFRVDAHSGRQFTLVDIPGSYSLAAFSPDEYIAVRALSGCIENEAPPDIIVCVIDATNLERGLYLLFQVLQVGKPVVVALNMTDLAAKRGITVNAQKLSRALGGVPVVSVVGSKQIGIGELKAELAKMVENPRVSGFSAYDPLTVEVLKDVVSYCGDRQCCRSEYIRMLFDRCGPAECEFLKRAGHDQLPVLERCRSRLVERFGALSAAETGPLSTRAAEIVRRVVTTDDAPPRSTTERLDKVLLHPLAGPIILIGVMVLVFQAVFSWAAPIMEFIDGLFGSLADIVAGGMADGPLRSLLVDGVIGGVGSVLIFLPQIVILFLFIAFLEDSGYMPRAAFLVDRLFGWCGLSGKSFIPMLSSFACAVPGIMASRTIENRRLRLLTIMVSPLMSCSARLPVYTIMIAAFIPHHTYLGVFNSQGLLLTGLYLLGLIVAVVISFLVNRLIYKHDRGTFMMEMPVYNLPTPRSVVIRIFSRVQSFVARAGTVILAITIVIWAVSYFPRSAEVTAEFDRQAVLAEQQLKIRLVEAGPEADRAVIRADHDAELAEIERNRSGAYLRDSYFGRVGRAVAPVFAPLGWDWKITMATLASFPAREVIIATLGTIYNLGDEQDEVSTSLIDKMRQAVWDDGPRLGQPVFTPSVALSIMVFFALCAQCGATLVTIKAETQEWKYAVIAFSYMTGLAYVAALVVYQVSAGMGL